MIIIHLRVCFQSRLFLEDPQARPLRKHTCPHTCHMLHPSHRPLFIKQILFYVEE